MAQLCRAPALFQPCPGKEGLCLSLQWDRQKIQVFSPSSQRRCLGGGCKVSRRGLSVTSDIEPTGDCRPSPSPCISCTRKGTGLVQRSPFCSLHVPGSGRLGGISAAEPAPHQHPAVPKEMLPSSCPGKAGTRCHRTLWEGTGRIWGKAGSSPLLPRCHDVPVPLSEWPVQGWERCHHSGPRAALAAPCRGAGVKLGKPAGRQGSSWALSPGGLAPCAGPSHRSAVCCSALSTEGHAL